jgi:hypothetical protein
MFDAPFQPLAADLIDPDKVVLMAEAEWNDLTQPFKTRQFDGDLNVLSILHPSRFAHWQEFVMMGAYASHSLLYLMWTRLFGAYFREHPLQRLLQREHTNGHRLTIFWFWEERCTRSFLSQTCATGGSMQTAMTKAVADFFGEEDFLWSMPQATKDKFWQKGRGKAFKPALRLSGKSLGQNAYRDQTRLALLSVINFTPQQYNLLSLLGFSNEEVDEAHGDSLLYQDLMRANIREPNSDLPVTAVVPCLARAKALEIRFPGCTLKHMPEHLIPSLIQGKKRGPKPSGAAATPAERQRKRREKLRWEREQAKQREREAA